MISNCRGCQEDLRVIEQWSNDRLTSEEKLYFAGKGLYEKGHILLILVNEEGDVVIE